MAAESLPLIWTAITANGSRAFTSCQKMDTSHGIP